MSATLNINAPSIIMRAAPDRQSEPINELLYGEGAHIIDNAAEGWVKIKAAHDGYDGFIPADSLAQHKTKTHKIGATLTHLYDAPDFKTTPRHAFYFLSPVHATDIEQDDFTQLANGGWVYTAHLSAHQDVQPDYVETALMFINAPYLWGGRTAGGLDCSGLLQISLMAAGVPCPRDTKDQMESIGEAASKDISNLKRGDLVFFKRHVGIMIDQSHILNATSRHMATRIESVSDLEKIYDGILSVRRLPRA